MLNICRADDPEFRAFWVDAYHPGYKDAAQVTKLIADVRAAHCNTIFLEVRRRGDAYYDSHIDPKSADIAPGFDPLADVIAKAHDTNQGPRLEVHAWIVCFPLWDSNTTLPASPEHVYLKHPDWLTRNEDGEAWNYKDFTLDPGHPGVQQYLFDVSMDIISRYDVDGFHLDYIRYCNNTFGYNHKSVARFNASHGRFGQPGKLDPEWMQFRRDQVTGLVRKIYLNAIALKPQIKLSVAGNSYAPGISTLSQWPRGSAYSFTLQDWRGWLEEGIVDLVTPMDYFRAEKNSRDWNAWTTFDKNSAYHRGVVIGAATYLNNVKNALAQLHSTRTPSQQGNHAMGVAIYTYGELSNDGMPRDKYFKILTEPSDYDPDPIFAHAVPVPALSWKTHPTTGHLKGFVFDAENHGVDGAKVSLRGATTRTLTTDPTGFYGAVDLSPGKYEVSAEVRGNKLKPLELEVPIGKVTTRDLK
ncbi:MAG: family 10 glycosylhydrolase [Limisphaerales bacterium]